MPIRLLAVLATLLLASACMAPRSGVGEAVQPPPAGIMPLTVEQDDQLAG